MKRRSVLVSLLSILVALATLAAYAAWMSTATGSATASGDDLVGNKPSGSVAGDDVTVSWSASTFNDGTAATGYTVRRYSAPGGTLQTIGADCTGTVAALTCTEQNVAAGSWQYTVTPHYATWTGTESLKSDVVVVVAVVLDGTAPTTTASASPAANADGWHAADVTVTLTATDPAPGVVKQITYSAAGAQTINAATVLGSSATVPAITTDGTTTVSFFAEDVAGNVEATKTFVVKLDKTSPTATLASPVSGRIKNGHSLTGTYADATSGVASVDYFYCPTATATCTAANGTAIGSSSTSPYSVTWNSQPADGNYKVVANAKDVAGNNTLSNTVALTVDNTAPTVAITGWTDISNGNTKVKLSGTGEAGGTVVVVICLTDFPCSTANTKETLAAVTVQGDGTWQTGESGNTGSGTRWAQATETDLAGNTGSSASFSFTQ